MTKVRGSAKIEKTPWYHSQACPLSNLPPLHPKKKKAEHLARLYFLFLTILDD
jgi:hypothetical protein